MDLRTFIDFVKTESPREYLQVGTALSGDWELAALVAQLERKMRAPLLFCLCVKKTDFPVVTNVCASWSRVAKSLGMSVQQLEQRLVAAYEKPIPPRVLAAGSIAPVRENIFRGDKIDLFKLPKIRYTANEVSPYLSAACIVAKDSATDTFNLSYHRLMLVDSHRAAIYMTPNGHLKQIFSANKSRGLSTPIAVFIGAHPLWSLGALAAGGMDTDEFGVIGGLLGEPLPVTPGLLNPELLVPSNAEIVLEGVISHERETPEGPYGEGLGYQAQRADQPVFQVELMSTRNDPIYQDIVPGRMEHLNMSGLSLRLHLQLALPKRFTYIEDLHLPAALTLYLQIGTAQDSETLKDMISWIFTSQRYVKHIVVFDSDIDIRNPQRTTWAMATRVQADRDVFVFPGQTGNGLDPSERQGLTTKWGIDATLKPNETGLPVKNTLPEEVAEKIDLKGILGG